MPIQIVIMRINLPIKSSILSRLIKTYAADWNDKHDPYCVQLASLFISLIYTVV